MRFWLRRIRAVAGDTRGAEVAELATVLPLLIVILLGIMWFGRAFNIYTTLNRAARAGAEAAALRGCATCVSAPLTEEYVKNQVVFPILQAAHLDPSLVTDSFQLVQHVPLTRGSPVVLGTVVTMKYPYSFTLQGVTCCPASLKPIRVGVTVNARSAAREEE